MNKSEQLRQVIDGGYCIGCGACAVAQPESIRMQMDSRIGLYQAHVKDNVELDQASRVCPFSDECPNESEIAEKLYGFAPHRSDIVGNYINLYAGYARETRTVGSSGGILTWVLKKLLLNNLIDAAICVEPTVNPEQRFRYTVITNWRELLRCAKSAYYPVTLAEVIAYVIQHKGRYAITGIPCFQKALRALRRIDPVLDDRILFQIGMVCGQMKSSHYADYLIRLAGLEPLSTGEICFREKNSEGLANNYFFKAKSLYDENNVQRVSNRFIGNNWAMGFFKPLACDFCDDVFAETADLVSMDAWLPKYLDDTRGYSLVISRHPELQKLLDVGAKNGELAIEGVEENDIIASQKGCLNHRRIGLRYRLYLKDKRNKWVPRKRITPSDQHALLFKLVQHSREWVRRKTFDAYLIQHNKPGLRIFNRKLKMPLLVFNILNRIALSERFGEQPGLKQLIEKYHLEYAER